jgi:hypothetical protein
MELKHGQYIDADKIERLTASWDGSQFETLCNAYVWSIAPHAQLSSLANTPDGGIDAEVIMDENWDEDRNPVLKRGWNVFQYKKRYSRKDWNNIKSNVKGKFKELSSQKTLSKYILITNIPLSRDQIAKIEGAIADGLEPKPLERIEIIDAGKLEAFLNNYPHIRTSFFSDNDFQTWQDRHDAEERIYPFQTKLIGREQEKNSLIQFWADERIQCIVVSGPRMIGKSRLILESTVDRENQIVYALNPELITFKDLDGLTNFNSETICVIEDPPTDKLADISKFAYQINNLRIVIALPTEERYHLHNFGMDDRTQHIHLQSLGWFESRELIYSCQLFVPDHMIDWIIKKSGGNPGILIAAVQQIDRLIEDQSNFEQQIGKGFESDIQRRFGDEAVKILKYFSIMTHVGVSDEYRSEIETICDVFSEVDINTVLNQIDRLVSTGYLIKKGDFVEISIPLLANHLAEQVIQARKDQLFILISKLKTSASFRLFARLCQIKCEETTYLWDELFVSLFTNIDTVFRYANIVEFLAGTVPNKVIDLLENKILDNDSNICCSIKGDNFRNLLDILEQLLFRRNTSYQALRLIALLSVEDSDSSLNLYKDTLIDSYHYLSPYLPLPYHDRLNLIDELIDKNNNKIKTVLIQTIGRSFNRNQHWSPIPSKGYTPFDIGFKPSTWGDINNYAIELTSRIWDIAFNESITKDDRNNIIRYLGDITDISVVTIELAKHAVKNIEKIKKETIKDSNKYDIYVLDSQIKRILRNFEKVIEKNHNEDIQNLCKQLSDIQDSISNSKTETQLNLLIGGWGHTFSKDEEKELVSKLCCLFVSTPEKFTNEIQNYLFSDEAKRAIQFFYQLGCHDKEQNLWDIIFQKTKENSKSEILFINYFSGLSTNYYDKAVLFWSDKIDQPNTSIEIWINTLKRIKPTDNLIQKLISKIHNNEIDPVYAASSIENSRFFHELKNDDLLIILQALMGENYQNPLPCLRLLHWRYYSKKELPEILQSYGWLCLDNLNSYVLDYDLYDIDMLAVYLARNDLEKGFKVFKNSLERYAINQENKKQSFLHEKLWKPICKYTHTDFADYLREKDNRRLYEVFLDVKLKYKSIDIEFRFLMTEYLDLDKEFGTIVDLAKENRENASIISNWITSKHNRFYEFVDEILPQYPNDEEIRDRLLMGVEQMSLIHNGKRSEFLDSLIPQIDKRINDTNTHIVTKEWLKDVKDSIKKQKGAHLVWDYNRTIDDLRNYINDKDSELRNWAMGRILRHGTIKDIQELLTIEEINEALKSVTLPEKRKELLEKALPVWQNG